MDVIEEMEKKLKMKVISFLFALPEFHSVEFEMHTNVSRSV
jgi:hypothetical protein